MRCVSLGSVSRTLLYPGNQSRFGDFPWRGVPDHANGGRVVCADVSLRRSKLVEDGKKHSGGEYTGENW